MVAIELYIGGTTDENRVDLYSEFDFAKQLVFTYTNFDIEDIGEIPKTATNIRLEVPATQRNERNFEFLGRIDAQGDFRNNFTILDGGAIVATGIVLAANEQDVKVENSHIAPSNYKLTLIFEESLPFTQLQNFSLAELSYNNVVRTGANVFSGTRAEVDDGDKQGFMAVKERAYATNFITESDFVPFLYLRPILQDVFASIGYSLQSDFFQNNQIKTLAIPLLRKAYDEAEAKSISNFFAKVLGDGLIYGGLLFGLRLEDPNISGAPYFDINDEWEQSSAGAPVQPPGLNNANEGDFFRAKQYGLYAVESSVVLTNSNGFSGTERFFLQVIKNGDTSNPVTSTEGTYNSSTDTFSLTTYAAVLLDISETIYITVAENFTSSSILNIEGSVTISPINFGAETVTRLNNTVYVDKLIPREWLFIDLLKDLKRLFNLGFRVDTLTKTIRIEPLLDWSVSLSSQADPFDSNAPIRFIGADYDDTAGSEIWVNAGTGNDLFNTQNNFPTLSSSPTGLSTVLFDGTQSINTTNINASISSNSYTVSYCVNITSNAGSSPFGVICRLRDNQIVTTRLFENSEALPPQGGFIANVSGFQRLDYNIDLDSWQIVTVTVNYNGTPTINAYVNGNLRGTLIISGASFSFSDFILFLFGRDAQQNFGAFNLAEFVIEDGIASQQKITNIYRYLHTRYIGALQVQQNGLLQTENSISPKLDKSKETTYRQAVFGSRFLVQNLKTDSNDGTSEAIQTEDFQVYSTNTQLNQYEVNDAKTIETELVCKTLQVRDLNISPDVGKTQLLPLVYPEDQRENNSVAEFVDNKELHLVFYERAAKQGETRKDLIFGALKKNFGTLSDEFVGLGYSVSFDLPNRLSLSFADVQTNTAQNITGLSRRFHATMLSSYSRGTLLRAFVHLNRAVLQNQRFSIVEILNQHFIFQQLEKVNMYTSEAVRAYMLKLYRLDENTEQNIDDNPTSGLITVQD